MEAAAWFNEGGWTMYPIVLIGMAAMPASLVLFIVALTRKKQEMLFAAILLALGLLSVGVGALGYHSSMRMVDDVLKIVEPDEADTIRNKGMSEARTPLIFGLMAGLMPLVTAAVLAGRSRTRDAPNKAIAAIAPIALGVGVLLAGIAFINYEAALSMGNAAQAVADESEKATIAAAADEDAKQASLLALIGLAPLALGTVLAAVTRR